MAPGMSQEDHRGSRLFAGGSIDVTRMLLPWNPLVALERNPGARLTEMATPFATAEPTLLTETTYVARLPVVTCPVAAAPARTSGGRGSTTSPTPVPRSISAGVEVVSLTWLT